MQFGSGSTGKGRKGKEGGGGAVVLPGATTCFADEDALIVNGTAARSSAMTIWPGEGRLTRSGPQ